MRLGMLAGGLAILVGTCSVAPHFTRENYQVRVIGTERVVTGSGDSVDSKYVVFTTDYQTGEERAFENTDSLIEGKLDSSTLQVKIKAAEKESYPLELKTYGWRIPFFSMYKNIIGAKKIQ